MLSWFDASEAKEFGSSLARYFIEKTQPNHRLKDKLFAAKVDKTLSKMAGQIVQFKLHHKLNTYKKAQLGNAFKWALRDAGQEQEYADELTRWLMVQLG